jgi:prophage antirepressor-like protein
MDRYGNPDGHSVKEWVDAVLPKVRTAPTVMPKPRKSKRRRKKTKRQRAVESAARREAAEMAARQTHVDLVTPFWIW